jgi:uncharacterized membrane protein (UPF0127 family)
MYRKLLAIVLLMAAIGWFFFRRPVGQEQREFVRFRLDGQEYTAVVARQPAEIQLGLSGRANIGADAMLFLLPGKEPTVFWMYQMRFPLDFVWLANGRVVDRHENVPAPPPDAPRDTIATVRPDEPVEAVLELPAGFIAEHQVQLDDEFALSGQFFRQVW